MPDLKLMKNQDGISFQTPRKIKINSLYEGDGFVDSKMEKAIIGKIVWCKTKMCYTFGSTPYWEFHIRFTNQNDINYYNKLHKKVVGTEGTLKESEYVIILSEFTYYEVEDV